MTAKAAGPADGRDQWGTAKRCMGWCDESEFERNNLEHYGGTKAGIAGEKAGRQSIIAISSSFRRRDARGDRTKAFPAKRDCSRSHSPPCTIL